MIDLHTHSTASDGSLTPTELVALAKERGLSYLALTDHNTTAGLPEFLSAAGAGGLCPIPGAELSCQWEGQELHILALDLHPLSFPQLEGVLAEALSWAEESKRDLVDRLRRAGYPICYETLQQAYPGSILNRAHIAMALVERGCASSVQEAFASLLDVSAGFYRPPRRLQAAEAVSMILDMGAIPVWAHPFLHHGPEQACAVLEALTPKGLAAMEAFYAAYTPAQTEAALALAKAFRLKVSGGSDFHGRSKPNICLGSPVIADSVAEALLRR